MSNTRDHAMPSIDNSNKGIKSPTLLEKVIGTVPATLIQMGSLHPLDTVAKRLVKNKTRVTSLAQLNNAIFLNKSSSSYIGRYGSLYAGFGSGLQYKLLQTTYKFSFQPQVAKVLNVSSINGYLEPYVAPSMINPFVQAMAGAITGGLEVVILPLDMAKIKKQNNPDLKNKSLVYLIGQEVKHNGLSGAYKGAGITVARNVPGSASLFLFPALVYSYVLDKNKANASGFEQACANSTGALASLICSHPQDLIKIRKQSEFTNHSSWVIAKEIVKKEGIRAFNKGLPVKLMTQIPKLTVVATLSDVFANRVQGFGLFATSFTKHVAEKNQQEKQVAEITRDNSAAKSVR